ncbi:hypothetical protein BKA70DRAFT_1451466 [Coprinopsis sp. MPI-PUGE-AT-0042]|nr:hypothetical protein BKA70DRAFT_1451466 [Coprinopsis sp. MPI-PUGE-AT-0042]
MDLVKTPLAFTDVPRNVQPDDVTKRPHSSEQASPERFTPVNQLAVVPTQDFFCTPNPSGLSRTTPYVEAQSGGRSRSHSTPSDGSGPLLVQQPQLLVRGSQRSHVGRRSSGAHTSSSLINACVTTPSIFSLNDCSSCWLQTNLIRIAITISVPIRGCASGAPPSTSRDPRTRSVSEAARALERRNREIGGTGQRNEAHQNGISSLQHNPSGSSTLPCFRPPVFLLRARLLLLTSLAIPRGLVLRRDPVAASGWQPQFQQRSHAVVLYPACIIGQRLDLQ